MNSNNLKVYHALKPDTRALLGLGLLGATDFDSLVELAPQVCPAPSVVESIECLIAEADRINCPQGKRLEALEHICKNPVETQKGLLNRTLRYTDSYIEFVTQIPDTTTVTKIDFWETALTKIQEIGITNLGKAEFERDRPFVISAFQIQYATGANPYDAYFGQMETVADATLSSTASSTRTLSRILFPPRLSAGLFTLKIGEQNGNVIYPMPMGRFTEYSYDSNSIGFVKLDSTLFVPAETKIQATIDLHQNYGFTPPAGTNAYLKLRLHGTGIIKA